MTSICKACNAKGTGMINIHAHPNKIDEMFTFVCCLTEVRTLFTVVFKLFILFFFLHSIDNYY